VVEDREWIARLSSELTAASMTLMAALVYARGTTFRAVCCHAELATTEKAKTSTVCHNRPGAANKGVTDALGGPKQP
jgi:hypothetical protein